MPTTCSVYSTDADAQAAVERLIADGVAVSRITVLMGTLERDHRDDAVGGFAGHGGPVGAFAGAAGSSADTMGSFAGAAGRRGGYGDADRDLVTTYSDGARRIHVASHRELERILAEAGIARDVIAADVAALHQGHTLVVVSDA